MAKSVALKDLMELAKMDNNSMRSDLVGRLAQGDVKSIAEGSCTSNPTAAMATVL